MAGTGESTERLLIEVLVATIMTIYCAAIMINFRGLMDFFLRQAERNRRFMRRIVFLPVDDRHGPYPPHLRLFRVTWKVSLGVFVALGVVFVCVRTVQLASRLVL